MNEENVNVENTTEEKTEKSYSQKELKDAIKKEKAKATEELLKELGVKDFDSAKEGISKYLESVEKNKTDLQKANESVENLNEKIKELTNKNIDLDLTNKSLIANVKSDNIADFVAIVKSRITSEKTADEVISELKENQAYSGFFSSVENNEKAGTGSPVGVHKKSGNNLENYGRELAKKFISANRPDINSKE